MVYQSYRRFWFHTRTSPQPNKTVWSPHADTQKCVRVVCERELWFSFPSSGKFHRMSCCCSFLCWGDLTSGRVTWTEQRARWRRDTITAPVAWYVLFSQLCYTLVVLSLVVQRCGCDCECLNRITTRRVYYWGLQRILFSVPTKVARNGRVCERGFSET